MLRFSKPETAVLMVCTANICRSPMAEGLMRQELGLQGLRGKFRVESAGTHVGQSGRAADPRAQRICKEVGIDLHKCRARQMQERDFVRFDYILAMDKHNEKWLLDHRPSPCEAKIALLGSWAGQQGEMDIPDPYFGNLAGFASVMNQLRAGIRCFLQDLTGISHGNQA